jgi:rhamnosyltransferase
MPTLFIVGSRGVPANYGGFETFAEEIATRLSERGIEVYVTCEHTSREEERPSRYDGVNLLHVEAPDNHLRTIVADCKALRMCRDRAEPGDIIYLLGYGVGPFAWPIIRSIKKRGIRFWLNPDGLEWQRPRWSKLASTYLYLAESFLLRYADKVICDAEAIKEYHQRRNDVPPERTEVIEYGAPLMEDTPDSMKSRRSQYLDERGLQVGDYYLYVGRCVPDNNMELMIRGVLDERVRRKLLVISNYKENRSFHRHLEKVISKSGQPGKVVLAEGVYDQPLLQAIRSGAFAYVHGHEAGGTNPALIEAMGVGCLCIGVDVPFVREMMDEAGIFFDKRVENFVQTLLETEALSDHEVDDLRRQAQQRVRDRYNWRRITDKYERLLRPNSYRGERARLARKSHEVQDASA